MFRGADKKQGTPRKVSWIENCLYMWISYLFLNLKAALWREESAGKGHNKFKQCCTKNESEYWGITMADQKQFRTAGWAFFSIQELLCFTFKVFIDCK